MQIIFSKKLLSTITSGCQFTSEMVEGLGSHIQGRHEASRGGVMCGFGGAQRSQIQTLILLFAR